MTSPGDQPDTDSYPQAYTGPPPMQRPEPWRPVYVSPPVPPWGPAPTQWRPPGSPPMRVQPPAPSVLHWEPPPGTPPHDEPQPYQIGRAHV